MNSAGALSEDYSIPLLESESDRSVSQSGRTSYSALRPQSRLSKVALLAKPPFAGVARHTLGIILLLATVILWTASNFLASVSCVLELRVRATENSFIQTIFADNTYSKPYFVTYANSSFFTILLPVVGIKRLLANNASFRKALGKYSNLTRYSPIVEGECRALPKSSMEDGVEGLSRFSSAQLSPEHSMTVSGVRAGADGNAVKEMMDFRETARLSFEFCFLWV